MKVLFIFAFVSGILCAICMTISLLTFDENEKLSDRFEKYGLVCLAMAGIFVAIGIIKMIIIY